MYPKYFEFNSQTRWQLGCNVQWCHDWIKQYDTRSKYLNDNINHIHTKKQPLFTLLWLKGNHTQPWLPYT